jgi:hypothetical protein
VKGYVIADPAPVVQPFLTPAILTTRDQWKWVVGAGGGVKYRLQRHVQLRFDFRDYITTFPKAQIAPIGSNTARGIFQQFTPLLGVSWMF